MIKIMNKEAVIVDEKIVYMREMKPLQVGEIVDDDAPFDRSGHIVMRTMGSDIEVMDLTQGREGDCWTGSCTIKVRLLRPDEVITLEVRNA